MRIIFELLFLFFIFQISVAIIKQQELMANDGNYGDNFGYSLSISGNTLVIGSPFSGNLFQGRVYVFTQNGTNYWIQQQKLVPIDPGSDTYFGWSVSISGNTLVVGAPNSSISGLGATYIFSQNGTNYWNQQLELIPNDERINDFFGNSVSISGNTIIIGASGSTINGNSQQGAAYVFPQKGIAWNQQQKLVANDGNADDQFGYSVSISGNIAIIGSPGDFSCNSGQGSAYVFIQKGITWIQQQKLTASDGNRCDLFGVSVSISGNTTVIGASGPGRNFIEGSVYVFIQKGTTWIQQQKLFSNDEIDEDYFGLSVSVSEKTGNTIVVGAPGPGYLNIQQGAAYVFVQNGGVWNLQQKLIANDSLSFGYSVSISGNTIVIGAPETFFTQGATYVYSPSQKRR